MDTSSGQSESDLSARELSTLRERLQHLRDQLQGRVQREQAAAQQAESLAEPMDAAELTREQDDGVVLGARDRGRLDEIERALAKLENGSYGRSELSGRPIGFRRLLAIPWARTTADEAEDVADADADADR
jgi:DnaK suppressor protein